MSLVVIKPQVKVVTGTNVSTLQTDINTAIDTIMDLENFSQNSISVSSPAIAEATNGQAVNTTVLVVITYGIIEQ